LHPDPDLLPEQIAGPLSMAERAALRRADPGPVSPGHFVESPAIPSRQARLSPLLFDLTPWYNRPLAATVQTHESFEVDAPQFVPGVHRLLGVDYDARGTISVSQGEAVPGIPMRVAGIQPGVSHFVALNVLVTANTMLRTQEQVPYAFLELQYSDGGRARLPILYNRDIKEWWRTRWNTPGRIAWRLRDFGPGLDEPSQSPSMVTVRLVNPHPQREVASLALEAVKMQFSSPSFLAITAEPAEE
jgi:hypothetical protein